MKKPRNDHASSAERHRSGLVIPEKRGDRVDLSINFKNFGEQIARSGWCRTAIPRCEDGFQILDALRLRVSVISDLGSGLLWCHAGGIVLANRRKRPRGWLDGILDTTELWQYVGDAVTAPDCPTMDFPTECGGDGLSIWSSLSFPA